MVKKLDKVLKKIDKREKKHVAKKLFDDFSLTLLALGFLAVVVLYFESFFLTIAKYENIYTHIGSFAAIISSFFVLTDYFRRQNRTEKTMKYYLMVGIFVNGSFGLLAAIEILKNTQEYLIIFPIINILSALYFIHMLELNKINEHSIIQTEFNKTKFMICGFVLLAVIILSKYVWHQQWFYTLSIVLAITSFFGINTKTE